MDVEDRPVVQAAVKRAEETGFPAAAIGLPRGRIDTGETSSLPRACSPARLDAP